MQLELMCINIGLLLFAVPVVGFVQPKYSVSEDTFYVDVCVRVFNPSPHEELLSAIDLIIQPRTGTAGKFVAESQFFSCVYSYAMLTLLTDELDFRNRIIPSVSFSPMQLECPERSALWSEF